ncbi:hypothetical protein [Dehalogenimonas etheniformans]|uniref:Bacterial Pleckstrin homology domain-containing protein n=1 Tax=Dehalogenimonas etheniformans TaxID=1536648 RepID=A0A2P5P8Y8_9CHLR|nr:hypothetical protein [Dehalogenimonas etheniformans]PPD58759.1 hypothetical protein JP09_002485 [Dehalogenimonas etheniformans]QNT76470.1 hypothetical protein HX448_07140 [Dehalogenimonas etheniformans]
MDKTYQEKMFSGLASLLAGAAGLFSLGLFASMLATDTVENASMIWFLPVTGLFLLAVAINFAFLTIKISPRGVSAGYGVFHHNIPAEDLTDIYREDASALAYGGFGIRFGWKDGKRRIVYNVIGKPGVVIQRRSLPDREFVFSSNDPEKVMSILRAVKST